MLELKMAEATEFLKVQLAEFKIVSADMRSMARELVEVSVKLDRVIVLLDGTGPHDIGLVRKIENLDRETITKKQVFAFAAAVSSVWAVIISTLSSSFHFPWNAH